MISAARLAAALSVLCCVVPAPGADRAPLERGTARIDPLALRELELGEHWAGTIVYVGFGLRPFVSAAGSSKTNPIANDELFALPSMAPVRAALDAEFDRYVARHKAELP